MIVIGLYIALHRHYLNFYLFLIEIFVLAGTIRAKSMVMERRKNKPVLICTWLRLEVVVSANGLFIELFDSHEWPRQNFSSQSYYEIKQTSDENKEKY